VLALAIAGLATVVVAAAVTRPSWLFVHSPAARAGSETLAGLAALGASWVALLRAERTRSANDLALAVAIGVIALTGLMVAALTVVTSLAASAPVAWAPVPGRLGGAALLIVAGASGGSRIPRLPGRLVLALLIAMLTAALGGLGALIGEGLGGPQVPLSIRLTTIALYLVGAFALARRGRRWGDRALSWYAAAALALAGTRLVFFLLPAPANGWLAPGDLARLVAGGLLLMAVRAELADREGGVLEKAIEAERRRLAREIHDGLAQELAFIVSQSRRLTGRAPDAGGLQLLSQAAQTALADARCTILNLKRSNTKALSATIAERAFVIAGRAGLALDVEVQGEVAVEAEVEHAILRIVSEAVSNAARHAGASTVFIRISPENDRVVVRVTDDGHGFDARALHPRRGFGLLSMTERAESLGGRLRLESEPGHGTIVEVAL
jgi:signal transduction histidine kinase